MTKDWVPDFEKRRSTCRRKFTIRITNNDLAQKLGITKTYVSMILSGERNPPNAEQTFRTALDELIAEKSAQSE